MPTCRLLVGDVSPFRESVLEGAALAVRGAGAAVGARGDHGVAVTVEDTEMPEDNSKKCEGSEGDHLKGLLFPK